MTKDPVADIRQWVVSARSRGEVLATSARGPGVDLVMVGVPSGYSAEEVESWLGDLMGMAMETSSAESGDRPIPPLLHHLLTGLIFSHSEMWNRGRRGGPASMAFVRTPGEVAFGWVNGPPPDLWIDDHRANVEWVRIRDNDGREAQALSIDPAHRVRVRFGLAPSPANAAGTVSVDAAWVPDPAATIGSDPKAPPARAGAPASHAPPAVSTISRAVGARASTASAGSVQSPSPMRTPDLVRAAAPHAGGAAADAGGPWSTRARVRTARSRRPPRLRREKDGGRGWSDSSPGETRAATRPPMTSVLPWEGTTILPGCPPRVG